MVSTLAQKSEVLGLSSGASRIAVADSWNTEHIKAIIYYS